MLVRSRYLFAQRSPGRDELQWRRHSKFGAVRLRQAYGAIRPAIAGEEVRRSKLAVREGFTYSSLLLRAGPQIDGSGNEIENGRVQRQVFDSEQSLHLGICPASENVRIEW